jgi:hypothetical protein
MKSMAIIFALLSGSLASANTLVTFTNLPAVYLNGSYNGFVGGYFGSSSTTQFDDLICDDFLHATMVPSGPWNYIESTLSTLENTRFGAADILDYEAASLLMIGDGNGIAGLEHVTSPQDVTSYNYAIWRLFTPDSAMETSGSNPNFGTSTALMNLALADVNLPNAQSLYGDDFSLLRIWTPGDGASQNQEFLQVTTPTPEPTTAVLLLTGGLFIFVGIMLKKRGVRKESLETEF